MVIIGPPSQRVVGVPREHLYGKAQTIEIWNNTRDRDKHALPAIQPGHVSNEPACEKMSDRAHLEAALREANGLSSNIIPLFSQQLAHQSARRRKRVDLRG